MTVKETKIYSKSAISKMKTVLPQYDVKIISLEMKNVLFILFAVEFFISVSRKSLDMFLVIHELNSPLKLLYNN